MSEFWQGVIFVLVLEGFGYYAWWLYQRRQARKRRDYIADPPRRPQATPRDYADKHEP